MGKIIGAAEFKARCLKILDEVDRTRETVTVTKRGRPVAEVRPVAKPERKLTFGCMRETILSFEDPFSPAYDEPWNAEKGIWEPEE
ncbi:MAG TPA: type II toxin-antitoxin system Phd/YefM family antitoxin [Allosphingosinicella sp.]|jgi:prevent-host-death family protein